MPVLAGRAIPVQVGLGGTARTTPAAGTVSTVTVCTDRELDTDPLVRQGDPYPAAGRRRGVAHSVSIDGLMRERPTRGKRRQPRGWGGAKSRTHGCIVRRCQNESILTSSSARSPSWSTWRRGSGYATPLGRKAPSAWPTPAARRERPSRRQTRPRRSWRSWRSPRPSRRLPRRRRSRYQRSPHCRSGCGSLR